MIDSGDGAGDAVEIRGEADDLLDELLRPDGDRPADASGNHSAVPVGVGIEAPGLAGPPKQWLRIAAVLLGLLALGGGAFWLGRQTSGGTETIASPALADSNGEAADGASTAEPGADDGGANAPPAHGGEASAGGTSGARLTANLQSGRLELRGVVPNDFIAERVLTVSNALYTVTSSEGMTVETSLPHIGWGPGADEAVAALSIVSNGSIELDGNSATIRGEPRSTDVQLRFRSAVQEAVGPAVQLIDETTVVAKDQPTLVIKKTGSNTIEVSGVVPGEEVAATIETSIIDNYRNHDVVIDFTFDDGVLDSFALYNVPNLAALFTDFPAWEVSYVRGELKTSSSGAGTFDVASTDLSPVARTILDSIAAGMRADPTTRLIVEGHTDSMGSDDNNFELSENRAKAVVEYLRDQGIDETRLTAVGFGETRPIADNATEEGRTMNRRVNLSIKVPGG